MSCFTFAAVVVVVVSSSGRLHKPGRREIFFLLFYSQTFFLPLSRWLTFFSLSLVFASVFCTSLNYSRLILISFIFSCFRELLSAADDLWELMKETRIALHCTANDGVVFIPG